MNDAFAVNLLAEQYFYIKFIIQLSLVTNGVSLLDGSHRAMFYLKSKWYQRKGVYWEDDYQFPLGYNQSYCLVVFMNCLLFSITVPVIPLFASIYFHIKYHVDKNNLIFNYCTKFESGGQIRSSTRNFMIFNLYFYMVVTTAFFALRLSNGVFRYLGSALIILWTAVLWMLTKRTPVKMKEIIATALQQRVLVEENTNMSEDEQRTIKDANL